MIQPLISIIMSTYNWEKYIEKSIDSVLNQIYTNFEFIIIDDYSTDDTYKIIKQYLNKDERIVYVKNLSNLGLTKSLNKWLELANGKYIARIDDDDLWEKEKLEKQMKFLNDNKEYWIVWTNFKYIDETWKTIWNRSRYKDDLSIKRNILR
jgi:glycosyltransferase involved in cell wall biosynthesis